MSNRPTLGTSVAVMSAAAVLGFGGGAVLATVGSGAGAGAAAQAAPATSAATPSSAPAALTLASSAGSIAAGQQFQLSGTLTPAGQAALTVQRKLPGGDWTDFPVSVRSKPDGSFSTKVVTQRAGANLFRVVTSVAGAQVESAEVTVTVA